MISNEIKELIIILDKIGYNGIKIAEAINISAGSVYQILKNKKKIKRLILTEADKKILNSKIVLLKKNKEINKLKKKNKQLHDKCKYFKFKLKEMKFKKNNKYKIFKNLKRKIKKIFKKCDKGMDCNLNDIYEKEISLKKEELKMFKEKRFERMVMNGIDFLLRESVSIMNIINLLNGYYEREKRKK